MAKATTTRPRKADSRPPKSGELRAKLEQNDTIRTRCVEVVDDDGVVRFRIGSPEKGGAEDQASLMTVFDRFGQKRMFLGLGNGYAYPELAVSNGSNIIASFGEGSGSSHIGLMSQDGTLRWGAKVTGDGKAGSANDDDGVFEVPNSEKDDVPTCECEYADKSWHDSFLRIEDGLDAVVRVLLAVDGEDLEDLKRFVALHPWRNPVDAYEFAELVEYFVDQRDAARTS